MGMFLLLSLWDFLFLLNFFQDLDSLEIEERHVIKIYISSTNPPSGIKGTLERLFPRNQGQIRKLLNWVRSWVTSLFAHCLRKANRVGYGLLSEKHFRPDTQISRRLLAVPFLGNNTPSENSEFSHPDVSIGFTILSYAYEGMRERDIRDLILCMKEKMEDEHGEYLFRHTWAKFECWREMAKRQAKEDEEMAKEESGEADGDMDVEMEDLGKDKEKELLGGEKEVENALLASPVRPQQEKELFPSLEFPALLEDHSIRIVHKYLKQIPGVIKYYLETIVFPKTLNHPPTKIAASGVDLGSDIIFRNRLGFSGTPSDLLPRELRTKDCRYEAGSLATIFSVLSSLSNVQLKILHGNDPKEFLSYVARQKNHYNALIDVGAFVTGLTNEQVSRHLLTDGLEKIEACVYLNDLNEKYVITRSTDFPVPLQQAGVSLNKRFTFYDHIHTTGMDIKQAIQARAIVTIGKDTTWRDFAQGCWRMRGLGKGQTVDVLLPFHVHQLIVELSKNRPGRQTQSMDVTNERTNDLLDEDCGCDVQDATNITLDDFCHWLLRNLLDSEAMEFVQLCKQEASQIFREPAFLEMLASRSSSFSSIFQELLTPPIPEGSLPAHSRFPSPSLFSSSLLLLSSLFSLLPSPHFSSS
jgi:hypothetical protein